MPKIVTIFNGIPKFSTEILIQCVSMCQFKTQEFSLTQRQEQENLSMEALPQKCYF